MTRVSCLPGAFIVAVASWGCTPGPDPCPPAQGDAPIEVVLTFDDGPLAADIVDPVQAEATSLLQPLRLILDTLQSRRVHAVFYIKGPGNPENEVVLGPAIRDGLLAIRQGGQTMGYHAYRHDPSLWAFDFDHSSLEVRAGRDLDALQTFLDRILQGTGVDQATMFAPLFRQPYGGAGINQVGAERAAAARSWIYHGYQIDSFDWLINADSDPAFLRALGIDSVEGHIAFVRDRFADAALRLRDAGVVDVLLHVNSFTAQHLGEWMDALEADFAAEGRTVRFEVPACYLDHADPRVDETLLKDLILPSH